MPVFHLSVRGQRNEAIDVWRGYAFSQLFLVVECIFLVNGSKNVWQTFVSVVSSIICFMFYDFCCLVLCDELCYSIQKGIDFVRLSQLLYGNHLVIAS